MRLARLTFCIFSLTFAQQVSAGPIIAAVIAGQAITAAIVAQAIFQTIIGFALSSIASSLFGSNAKPPQQDMDGFQSDISGRLQVLRSSVATRQIAYGEFMRSGPLVYAETTGATNEYLHMIIVVAPHEIASFEELWLGDEKVGTIDSSGEVTTGRFAGWVRVKYHLGSPTQVADADLIAESAGNWTSSHKLSGCAYVYLRLKWSQDIWPGGIPNAKVLIRGKSVEDPRTGVSSFSNNWASCFSDYLITPAFDGGLGCDDDEVNETVFAASANTSDERVLMAAHTNDFTIDIATEELTLADTEVIIASGDGVSISTTGTMPTSSSIGSPDALSSLDTYYWIRTGPNTGKLASTYANALAKTAINLTSAGSGTLTLHHVDQARYTLNGAVDTSKKPKDILLEMLSAAAGVLTYPQGKFSAYPAAYANPVNTIGLSDLRGNIQVTPYLARRDLYNAVQGVYANPANLWEPSSFPIVTNELYEQHDNGERIVRDIELPFTADSVRAQRIAKVHLEMSRQGLVASLPCKMTAFKYAIWDTLYLTVPQLGFSAKVFRVINWKLAEQGFGVDLVVREEASANYDWASGDATVVDTAPNTNLQSARTVMAPGNPSISESLYETTGSAGVKSRSTVTWASSADAFVVGYDAQYRVTGSGDSGWLSLSPVSLLVAQQDDLAPGSYDFRVRAINSLAVRSDWSATVTKTLLGLTAAPSNVSGFSIIKSGGIGIAQFALHPDLDVRIGGRIVVRWSPLTSGATWNDSIIFEEFNGDAVSGVIPIRSGTYMAKAKDSTGNYSADEVSFVATEGMVTGFTTVGTITEHSAFTGSKSNVALVSSSIQLDGLTLIDSSVTNIDDWPFIDSYGGISATGSYAFTGYFNFAASTTRRLEASISASQFDTGALIDARTGNVDDWIDVDGTSVQDCDVTLYCRTSNDDPGSPTPTWSAWSPFFVGDYTFKTAEFKLDFISGSSNHNIAISALTVTSKIPT